MILGRTNERKASSSGELHSMYVRLEWIDEHKSSKMAHFVCKGNKEDYLSLSLSLSLSSGQMGTHTTGILGSRGRAGDRCARSGLGWPRDSSACFDKAAAARLDSRFVL